MKPLSPPCELIQKFPTPSYIATARAAAQAILERKDPRLAVLVGPCSIHDPLSAMDFALRLKKILPKVEKTLFPIMRFFLEKPRSRLGWKGIVYDPHLNGSHDIEAGLHLGRKLLTQMGELEIPCCMEFLDPLISFYVSDLITWGLIGARTSASQPHRQMASRFTFPIGFKNDIYGNLEVALNGILSARHAHSYIGISGEGQISALETDGNPLAHLVLRGSEYGNNYEPPAVENSLELLKRHSIEPRVLIDCSHGNSNKNAALQKKSFLSVIEQSKTNRAIAGLMLESHIFGGRQLLAKDPAQLLYGVSITDACLGWEETEALLLWANSSLSASRSISIHSVQN